MFVAVNARRSLKGGLSAVRGGSRINRDVPATILADVPAGRRTGTPVAPLTRESLGQTHGSAETGAFSIVR